MQRRVHGPCDAYPQQPAPQQHRACTQPAARHAASRQPGAAIARCCSPSLRCDARLIDLPRVGACISCAAHLLILLNFPDAGLWGPEEVDASTLTPLSRLSGLRSLRLDLSFTVSNAGGWDFLQCLQRLTSLHLEGEAASRPCAGAVMHQYWQCSRCTGNIRLLD